MDYLKIEFWGVLLNITGICFWGITMLHLIRNKNKGTHETLKKGANRNLKSFGEEMFVQMARQQLKLPFKRISDAILGERQLLWAFIERGELGKAKKLLLGPNFNEDKRMRMRKNNIITHRKSETGDKYREVVKLSDSGMTTKKISEKVKIPRGEIELLIKLRKKAHENPERLRAFS
ncbi:MAG: hypothetical protein JRJ20_01080 [Deltaproteobacteria bacterium]|nr:hypothetical protein [Deltaproteobacteria bacterium]